jgi:hypothetical protein
MISAFIGTVFLLGAAQQPVRAAEPLEFEKSIPLTGVEGRIDHMSADVKGNRLFVSALGNKSLEILDWNSGGRLKTIGGLDEPQGVLCIPANNRLYVATGGDGSVRMFDATTFALLKSVKLGDDADNIRFETGRQLIWVGYGSGSLAALDLEANRVADIRLDHHPESFQLEREGSRIFVNLPGSKNVAVVDRVNDKVLARWGTGFDFSNFPMSLDEGSRRLFIAFRMPARLLILDTKSGRIVSKLETVGDSDDIFYDAVRHRIYVTGGEGAVAAYEQVDPDRYRQIARIPTAPGARTSLFIPEVARLFVAVPRRDRHQAEIRVYKAN